MNTRTRKPGSRAHAMPTSHEVTVSDARLSAYYTRLVRIEGSGYPGSFRSVPARADLCRVPGCPHEMQPLTWDDGTAYRSCPNPEHPDTLSSAWSERAGQLELDPPPAFDVKGRL